MTYIIVFNLMIFITETIYSYALEKNCYTESLYVAQYLPLTTKHVFLLTTAISDKGASIL